MVSIKLCSLNILISSHVRILLSNWDWNTFCVAHGPSGSNGRSRSCSCYGTSELSLLSSTVWRMKALTLHLMVD